MEKPKQERQNNVRHPVLKEAQIVFKGREAVVDCVVRNLSDRGRLPQSGKSLRNSKFI